MSLICHPKPRMSFLYLHPLGSWVFPPHPCTIGAISGSGGNSYNFFSKILIARMYLKGKGSINSLPIKLLNFPPLPEIIPIVHDGPGFSTYGLSVQPPLFSWSLTTSAPSQKLTSIMPVQWFFFVSSGTMRVRFRSAACCSAEANSKS